MIGKQVTFTLNGNRMTGTVIRLGIYNPDFVVVSVPKGKTTLECWVKIDSIEK
jgi:hypothetical protein